ncbi:membrane-spanning 4-domains subfamily A member 7 isoform X1 [Panthera uncia]|uniref:membrane-spanning 4-domains subfamily A member 7 isoform X1 n=2 Tax=Panthera uncia TaxID=29064 RepID=UPI0020FFBDAB|nr:membrane-spanning 4-domains subfamily A member 7 isoform X1 [Panthera uncia]
MNCIVRIMLSKPKTKGAFDSFTPNGIIIPKREKPRHSYQKEDNPPNTLQKETTVLGIIQIMCCLLISSLGAILVSAPYSSHFKPTTSTILMSGYPFVAATCFAITGSLSIISGKKATMPFAMSTLTASAASSLAAGAGLFLLADSLVALETASRPCDSEREYLSSLPYSGYYYSTYEFKDCLLASVSLTGVLVVMLIFTVLELLTATYASILWWKQLYSKNPGSTFSMPQSQGHIQHVKNPSRSCIGVTPQKKKEKARTPGKVWLDFPEISATLDTERNL